MIRWQIDLLELIICVYVVPIVFLMLLISRFLKAITRKTFLRSLATLLIIVGGIFLDLRRDSEIRAPVNIPKYRVDFVESSGAIEHRRYFEVIRVDGKQASYVIDGDANKCENFNITHEESKVYFHCSEDASPNGVSYFDTQKNILFGGFMKQSRRIEDLDFR